MIIEKNQFGLEPGAYEHYDEKEEDGTPKVFIVENIVTHVKKAGFWFKLQDPYIVYRDLKNVYVDKKWVIQSYMLKLSEFNGVVKLPTGETVKRFKQL